MVSEDIDNFVKPVTKARGHRGRRRTMKIGAVTLTAAIS